MLTEEVEREVIREERKQKREEEEQEAERKKCKREMIVVKDGKVISGGDTAEEVQEEGDTSHAKTLIQQQSDMMKSQEVVIHTQEAQMIELQLKIRQLEAENQVSFQKTTTPGTAADLLASATNSTGGCPTIPILIQHHSSPFRSQHLGIGYWSGPIYQH